MINENILKEYERWVKLVKEDPDLIKELADIKNDEKLIEDAFYRELEFAHSCGWSRSQ